MTPTLAGGGRCSLIWGALVCVGVAGCVPAPSYPEPADEDKATLAPGFDPGSRQVARWSCPSSAATTSEGYVVLSPAYEVVLLQDPARGLLLHELNNDWLMAKPEMIAGGGAQFSILLPGTWPGMSNEFIVPPDHDQELTHHFRQWFVGYSDIKNESVSQMCGRAAPVRLL